MELYGNRRSFRVFSSTNLCTGNSDTADITNDAGNSDFQPDWLWIKNRDSTNGQSSFVTIKSTRGATKRLESSATDAEATSESQIIAHLKQMVFKRNKWI